MSKFTSPLDNVRIASPCSQSWDEMVGNERERFCGACRLNVYNLSGMSRRAAENLIFQSVDGRLCVRFYRRADGSILTKDCPVGWRALKRKISKTATAFSSLVFTACGAIGLTNYFGKSPARTTENIPSQTGNSKIESPAANTVLVQNVERQNNRDAIMGGMSAQENENLRFSDSGKIARRTARKHKR